MQPGKEKYFYLEDFADLDRRWSFVPLWSQVEVNVGIVAASLPSLSPLLKRVWSGFAPNRTTTPSCVRTLSQPTGNWDEQTFTDYPGQPSARKSNDLKGTTFYDDDEEESGSNRAMKRTSVTSQVGVAVTADARIPPND
jgi:hypothetical protein